MIYLLIGLSVLFTLIGFIVTENNAKYILSGYNTMSDEEQKQFNINGYLKTFKNFHLFLGLSFLIIGLGFYFFVSENASGIFLAIYPIIAYIYFISLSAKYAKGNYTKNHKIGIIALLFTLLLVITLLLVGIKPNNIIINQIGAEISGTYGETLLATEIENIELVNELPNIKWKTNGFAVGSIKKGYFKTENGETVKLILNNNLKPVILFTMANDKKIYYSDHEISNEAVFSEIKKAMPTKISE